MCEIYWRWNISKTTCMKCYEYTLTLSRPNKIQKKRTHLKFVYLVVETKYRNHYEFTCKFEMFIALEKYPPNPREMIVKLVRVEK